MNSNHRRELFINTKLNFLIGTLLSLVLALPGTAQEFVRESILESRPDVQVKRWTYTSDGLLVHGELYLPTGSDKLPLVLFNHDGISGISKEHRWSSIRLARQGYVVFSPSYRGEDGSQGVIEIAKGEVNDVLNAMEILKGHPRVDPTRIAMVGASHGALISVLAAARAPEVRAVVSAYGVMDIYRWYAYLKRTKQLGNDPITVRTYGPGPEARPVSFAIRNAVGVAPQLEASLLILQGELDTIVPPEQAHFMVEAMKKAGKSTESEIYPDALHGFLVYAPYLSDVTPQEKAQTESAWQTMFEFLKRELSSAP